MFEVVLNWAHLIRKCLGFYIGILEFLEYSENTSRFTSFLLQIKRFTKTSLKI